MSSLSSRYTAFTRYPWMPMPRICPATERASSSESAGLMPPAFPRADEDLCLDHAGERRIDDVVRSRCDGPPRNGDAIAGEDLLRLVFEELHADRSRRWVDDLYLL